MQPIVKHLSCRAFSPAVGIILGLVCVLTSGCATLPTAKKDIDVNEQKYALLQQQVRQQELKIERLTAALERGKSGKARIADDVSESPSAIRPIVKVLIEHIIPTEANGGEEVAEEDDDAKDSFVDDGDSIADSSQESMHWYFDGQRALKALDYEAALKNFRNFLEVNPEHVYADRAQFLMASTLFRNKEYGLSIVALNAMDTKYPFSFKLPEGLLMKALCFEKLGQADSAKKMLRELLKRFPDDSFADKASRKLAELGMAPGAQISRTPLLLDDSE